MREKLRLASTRNATVEEDIAYSLIGIFKSDIRPEYGEGYTALGHLLVETIDRSGEMTVLDWIGESSPYNSCLPASLAVYSHPSGALHAIDDAEMEPRVTALRNSLSEDDALLIHYRITCLPPARFANRRLPLPCILFSVKRLSIQDSRNGSETSYRARVSGIGGVEFRTSDRLSPKKPRKLAFVHPWLRELLDPLDGPDSETSDGNDDDDSDDDDDEYDDGDDDSDNSDSGSDFVSKEGSASSLLNAAPATEMDDYTRALRLIVRLQQPFRALLLQGQSNGEFKRVTTRHEIVIQGLPRRINFARDVRTGVVDVL